MGPTTASSCTWWAPRASLLVPVGPYFVTYDRNGATAGTEPFDRTNYLAGFRVTVLDNPGGLVNGVFPFVAWNTQRNASEPIRFRSRMRTFSRSIPSKR